MWPLRPTISLNQGHIPLWAILNKNVQKYLVILAFRDEAEIANIFDQNVQFVYYHFQPFTKQEFLFISTIPALKKY